MPWTPKEFKEKHNKSLSKTQATKAAAQANAMLKAGVPEGVAIATANNQQLQQKSKSESLYGKHKK